MAMRHERQETVLTQVVKSATKDVINGAKWVFDNFNKPGPLKKAVIMSAIDISYLEEKVEEDIEDEEVMDTVPSLSEASGKLQLAETTGELSSTDNIVVDTLEDAPCLQNESVDEASKDKAGSKVSNLYEGVENFSCAETHFSGNENVAKHIHNGGNTLLSYAKVEDSPSVYNCWPPPANSQEVVAAVPVLEAVGLSPIEPKRCLLPPLPNFEDSNSMDGNILSWNSILDPVSIPRIEEDEYNLPNTVIHQGSKLYEASSGVWVAEPIVKKPLLYG